MDLEAYKTSSLWTWGLTEPSAYRQSRLEPREPLGTAAYGHPSAQSSGLTGQLKANAA